MESVIDLLAECERRSIRLEIQGGRVVCMTPRRDVPDGLAEKLHQHKGEILARLECDRLIRQTLDTVNAACPAGWQPSADAWCGLDSIQWKIDAARDAGDVVAVERLCAEYKAEAGRLFERWKRGRGRGCDER